jgi:hypothetical protein
MEDVLETYQKPRDPDRPLVCLDETSNELIVETRAPIPAKPGRTVRPDYEYERNGVAQHIHDVRAAGRLAPSEGPRPRSAPSRQAVRMALHPQNMEAGDMAEFELGVLSSNASVAKFQTSRPSNERAPLGSSIATRHHAKADWQFTTDDARVKLKRLYPSL